jgi:hypothetical protein
MSTIRNLCKAIPFSFLLATSCLATNHASARNNTDPPDAQQSPSAISQDVLATEMKVGDIVFIRVSAKPFREVAAATNSWTNHVGIVVDISGEQPLISESTFPFSRTTTLSKFIARTENGRIAFARLNTALTDEQQQKFLQAAQNRSGIFYDTGFNLHSNRQFCSRYVHEIVKEVTGTSVGEVETFKDLLNQNPDANMRFWKLWYFGHIPWERETVTPASLLRSHEVSLMFDGVVTKQVAQLSPRMQDKEE